MRVSYARFNIVAIQIARNATRISVRRSASVHPFRRNSLFTFCLSTLIACAGSSAAQNSSQDSASPPVAFTADQDHQNMMDQLGIKALRPGPSGNEKAPNHANYDESRANPFPEIPDPLTASDGQKVTTAEMWWNQRRPEIVEMYSKYVYGRVPA